MDNNRNDRGESPSVDWRKESGDAKKSFNFDDFLEDDLETRITNALGGKDLLEPDAFGESVPSYSPRRTEGDAERGKHEAPTPVSTAQQPPKSPERDEKPSIDPNDPRYAAPERPRVVVAEPRKQVYVAPSGSDYEPLRKPDSSRGSRGLKTAAVILAVIAVIGGILIALLYGGAGSGGDADSTPRPASATQAPEDTKAPEATPTAQPQARTYRINVTAGSGGSVSPSGSVGVEEGKDASFTITPNAGYELSQLLIDGSSVALTDSYRFTDVRGDHTLYAVFTASATPTPPPTPQPTAAPTPEPTPEPTPAPTPEPTPAPTDPPAAVTEAPAEPPADEGTEP